MKTHYLPLLLLIAGCIFSCTDSSLKETTINFRVKTFEGFPVLKAEVAVNGQFEGFTNIQGYLQIKKQQKDGDLIQVTVKKANKLSFYSRFDEQLMIRGDQANDFDITLYSTPQTVSSEPRLTVPAPAKTRSAAKKRDPSPATSLQPSHQAEEYQPRLQSLANGRSLNLYNPNSAPVMVLEISSEGDRRVICMIETAQHCVGQFSAEQQHAGILFESTAGSRQYHLVDLETSTKLVYAEQKGATLTVQLLTERAGQQRPLVGATVQVNGQGHWSSDQLGIVSIPVEPWRGDFIRVSTDPGADYIAKEPTDFVASGNLFLTQIFSQKQQRKSLWISSDLNVDSAAMLAGSQLQAASSEAAADFRIHYRNAELQRLAELTLVDRGGQVIASRLLPESVDRGGAASELIAAVPRIATVLKTQDELVYFKAPETSSEVSWTAYGEQADPLGQNKGPINLGQLKPLRREGDGIVIASLSQETPRSRLQQGDRIVIAAQRPRQVKDGSLVRLLLVDAAGRPLQNVTIYESGRFLGVSDQAGSVQIENLEGLKPQPRLPGYRSKNLVRTSPGEYRLTLEKEKVEIAIDSDPSGAKVFIDQSFVGFTPFRELVPTRASSIAIQLDHDRAFKPVKWTTSPGQLSFDWTGANRINLKPDFFKKGQQLARAQHFEIAVSSYSKVSAQDPQYFAANLAIGSILAKSLSDPRRASRYFRMACSDQSKQILTAPEYTAACLGQGDSLSEIASSLAMQYPQQALEHYKKALYYLGRAQAVEAKPTTYFSEGRIWNQIFALSNDQKAHNEAVAALTLATAEAARLEPKLLRRAQNQLDKLRAAQSRQTATL